MAKVVATLKAAETKLRHALDAEYIIGDERLQVRLFFFVIPTGMTAQKANAMLDKHFRLLLLSSLEILSKRNGVTQRHLSDFKVGIADSFQLSDDLKGWEFADIQIDGKPLSPEVVSHYINRIGFHHMEATDA